MSQRLEAAPLAEHHSQFQIAISGINPFTPLSVLDPCRPPWVARPHPPLYDGFSTGLRAAAACATRRARTSLKTSWNHAPRIAQGLIKLAPQGHHGRGDW